MKLNLADRPCTVCKGTGINHHDAWTSLDGHSYPERNDACYACDGKGSFEAPDIEAIVCAITKPNKATGKRAFRKSKPPFENEFKNKSESRAYFVWRLARFHGGADVTMPVMAETAIHGDPFEPELNLLAEKVAKMAFGTDMAAAYRWCGALGHSVNVPDGQPASAYSCGPVADEHKPEAELPELIG